MRPKETPYAPSPIARLTSRSSARCSSTSGRPERAPIAIKRRGPCATSDATLTSTPWVSRCSRYEANDVQLQETSWGVMKRSEEHTSELQSQSNLVCRLLLEKKKKKKTKI